jgi:C-terminal processing protease CtpA/Prc
MTNAAMYSPKGRTWQGKGNIPDFLVEQDEKTFLAGKPDLQSKYLIRYNIVHLYCFVPTIYVHLY